MIKKFPVWHVLLQVSVLDKLDLFVTMILLAQLGAACQGQLQLLDPIWQQVIDALTVTGQHFEPVIVSIKSAVFDGCT